MVGAHNCASYYEKGIKQYDKVLDVNEVLLLSIILHPIAIGSSYRIQGCAPLHSITLRLPRGKNPGGRKHNDTIFFHILYWFEEKKEHHGQRRTLRTTGSDPQLTTNFW